MTERRNLLKYSSYFHGSTKESLEEVTRVALAELFTLMARAVTEEKDFPIHEIKHISLVLETDLWDHRLLLILDRDDSVKK